MNPTRPRCPKCPHRFALLDMAKDVYMCECGAATDAGKVADMEAKLEAEVSGPKSVRVYEVISEQLEAKGNWYHRASI